MNGWRRLMGAGRQGRNPGRRSGARPADLRAGRRAGLTMLGTILGVGAFVAVLGLTATAAGQVSRAFTVLDATTVTVQDNGPANDVSTPGTNPAIGFPASADAIARHIDGVVAAGVWWPVTLPSGTEFTSSPGLSATAVSNVNLLAASSGAVAAMGLTMAVGSPLTTYENDTGQHVAMIDAGTAKALGISPGRLADQPAGVRQRHLVHRCRRVQRRAACGGRPGRHAHPAADGPGRFR